MTSAVIVAAGSSRRMGFDKLFARLGTEPVVAYTMRAFLDHPAIGEVVVVTSAANRERIAALSSRLRVVEGGAERCHSVWNGLSALSPSCELVAIHDGARPLIHPESIAAVIDGARSHGAASLAHPITDTVKRADETGRVIESVDRSRLWGMETPQCFRLDLLREAYARLQGEDRVVTDEVSAAEAAGHPVFLVQNPFPNPKITFPPDLDLAQMLLQPTSS